jgi:hypothetical protein
VHEQRGPRRVRLRPLRTATITLGRQQITAEPRIPAAAQQILDDLTQSGH